MAGTDKEANRQPNYILLDFDVARKKKWADGVAKYRQHGEGFQGYRPEEAYQECIDLYNLLEDMEGYYGINYSIIRGMTKVIARVLQKLHLEHWR